MLSVNVSHNFNAVQAEIFEQFKAAQAKKLEIVRAVPIAALADVQRLSPVDTGCYRASHNLSIEAIDETTAPGGSTQSENAQRASQQLAHAQTALAGVHDIQKNLSIWISNHLPYAEALEHGSSKQAPNGIYAIARQRAEALFKRLSGQ